MTRRWPRRMGHRAERRSMQRIRRVRKNEPDRQEAPFRLFEEDEPAEHRRGGVPGADASGFPRWDADGVPEDGRRDPYRRREYACGDEDAPETAYEDDPDDDEYGEEDRVHPWAFDDGEDDDDPAPQRKPQHRGADAVRIGSGVLLAAAAAASTRLVLSGTLTPLLTVLESEDIAKHLSAMVLMAVEGLPVVLGLFTALCGLVLANRPRLAAVLRPLGRATAFFSALPAVVRSLRDGFTFGGVWTYLLLFAAAVGFLIPVRILRSERSR